MKKAIFTREGILDAFAAIGFVPEDLGERFLASYQGFKWYLIPHWRVTNVVYAVPADGNLQTQPWESWYMDGGVKTHHVHYAQKLQPDYIEWIQKEWTQERPDEVIGDPWYWYDDPDMRPALTQNEEEDK